MWLGWLVSPGAVLVAVLAHLASASYRNFHVDNADICNSGPNFNLPGLAKDSAIPGIGQATPKTLEIGTGAALFQMHSPSKSFQPNYRNKAKRCEIHVKAPENFGLTAYIEEMHMRKSSEDGKCVDYVQFGQNDIIPFVTIYKSDRLCGKVYGRELVKNGFTYDDPKGDLLIWVSLGGRRESSSWPNISIVNLTIVVTAYKKDCKNPPQNYRRCGERDRCIWQKYTCDKHFNCPGDLIPVDEDGCRYEDELSDTTTSVPGSSGNPNADFGELNFISLTLIIVASALVFLLFLLLLIKCKRSRQRCCRRMDSGAGSNCEMEPSGPRSLCELNRQRHLRETEQNVYLPLNTFHPAELQSSQPAIRTAYHIQGGDDSTEAIFESVNLRSGLPPDVLPPEEPPPAYEDLFPDCRGVNRVIVGGRDAGDVARGAAPRRSPSVTEQRRSPSAARSATAEYPALARTRMNRSMSDDPEAPTYEDGMNNLSEQDDRDDEAGDSSSPGEQMEEEEGEAEQQEVVRGEEAP